MKEIDRNSILNSEMYSLYCRRENERHRAGLEPDEEYVKEDQKEKQLAQSWLEGAFALNADEEYRLSGLKRIYDETQLKEHCIDPADEDLCNNVFWIEREVSGYCVLSPRVYYIIKHILESKDFGKWWRLLYELKYVPLQYGAIMLIEAHEDFMDVARTFDKNVLSHPITIATMLRNRWFEWVVRVSNNLSTYKTDDRIYKHNRYEDLIEEGSNVRAEWNSCLDDLLKDGFTSFCKILGDWDMLEWIYGIDKSMPYLSNEYSAIHDDILDRLRSIAFDFCSVGEIVGKTNKLQLLIAVADKVLEENNHSKKEAGKLWAAILEVLKNKNFVKAGEIHADDENCMMTIGRLWIYIYEDLEKSILDLLKSQRTHFEGWNVDHSEMYESVKLESFLMSIAVKVAFMTDMQDEVKEHYWKSVCEYIVNRIHNCDNQYIGHECLFIPLVFADYHARSTTYSGLYYLRNLILMKVHGIDTVLKILYMSSAEADSSIQEMLSDRIEREWPSCRELMRLRRQHDLIEQYEEVIERMTNNSKK